VFSAEKTLFTGRTLSNKTNLPQFSLISLFIENKGIRGGGKPGFFYVTKGSLNNNLDAFTLPSSVIIFTISLLFYTFAKILKSHELCHL